MSHQRPPDGRDRPSASSAIGHVVVFAGVSGSGKSTILKLLRTRKAPDSLTVSVPPDVATWPLYYCGQFKGWLPKVLGTALSGTAVPGFVIHYDLSQFQRLGMRDPVLGVFAFAREMTFVVLRPAVERLITQYEMRAAKEAGSINRDPQILANFRTPGWVDGLYDDWAAAIERVSVHAVSRVIEIEPNEHPVGGSIWRSRLLAGPPLTRARASKKRRHPD